MPPETPTIARRIALRGGLAAAGTLAAALLARKLVGGEGGPDGNGVAEVAAGPPPLQDASRLRPVAPPAALPSFAVAFAPAGGGAPAVRPVASGFGTRGTVLNFWATWCGPCRAEMPALARLAAALRPDGVAVLPVSFDRGGVDVVRSYYREERLGGLPVAVDADGAAMRALGLGAIPVTLLVDAGGRIVARLEGGADWGTAAAAALVRRSLGT